MCLHKTPVKIDDDQPNDVEMLNGFNRDTKNEGKERKREKLIFYWTSFSVIYVPFIVINNYGFY